MHRIRLRGPWETTPLAAGGARHVRRFGKPTNLGEGERVFLGLDGVVGTVMLNGEPAAVVQGEPTRVDVTARLQARNAIEVITEEEALRGEMALEIA